MSSVINDLHKASEEAVYKILSTISEKYSIDLDELNNLFSSKVKVEKKKESSEDNEVVKKEDKKKVEKVSPKDKIKEEKNENTPKSGNNDTDDLDPKKLLNYNLTELKALCKKNGHKVSGKKEELVNRLLGKEEKSSPVVKEKKEKKPKEDKEESTPKTSPKLLKKTDREDAKVLEKVTTPIINIRRDQKTGRYIHSETGLVFNKDTKEVIGKQDEDGNMLDLIPDDIETCKKYKFTYVLPENLDQNKKGLDDVKVEEIEEDKKETKVDKVEDKKNEMNDEKKEEEEEVEYEEYEYEEGVEYEEYEEVEEVEE